MPPPSPLLRFAPSPTGPLHLGGLRTALFNHLHARRLGGRWLLRIEDTDASRLVPGSVDGIRHALDWAGLEYDFGPGKDSSLGPYNQSERIDLYHSYAKRLLESGHAYRCFCSPDTLTTTRERLARTGANATYDRACLHLTPEEVARRVRAGERSVVRLNDNRVPPHPPSTDLVFGTLRDAHASLPTDTILLKSDGRPTYHLASVVDDHLMGITHVLRGEEWLPSLPLHLDLYACLRISPPQFAHVPILLNPDGSKMSKRHGDVRVTDFIDRGWEPGAVLNWLALAGWGVHHENDPYASSPATSTSKRRAVSDDDGAPQHAPDSTTVMSLPELIQEFDLASLTHRRNTLDLSKLAYLNKQHLARAGPHTLARRIHSRIKEVFPTSPHTNVGYIEDVISILQTRLTNLQDIFAMAPYFFTEPDLAGEEAVQMRRILKEEDYNAVLAAVSRRLHDPTLAWDEEHITTTLNNENRALGLTHKVFMTVLRHALTGMKTGPGIPETMKLLGRERTLARLAMDVD